MVISVPISAICRLNFEDDLTVVFFFHFITNLDVYVFITITGSIALLLSLGRYLYYYHWVDNFITITGPIALLLSLDR